MKYIVALDQGTTSSRAMLFDRRGRVCGVVQREFTQHYPQPGWVEHDPEQLWRSQLLCLRQVLKQAGVSASSLVAVGIANQRETTLVWERATGRPVHRAIVWQDRRTAERCAVLRSGAQGRLIRRRTGLLADPYFSASKLEWILDHVPGARRRAERGELAFGTVDTWLAWKLSRGAIHATDVSNAARTLLFDIHRKDWDEELLGLFRIPRALLPEVHPSSSHFGELHPDILGRPVPLTGMAGDQQAALFGQACLHPGMAKNTYGTGCFMLLNTGAKARPSRQGLLTTPAATLGARRGRDQYALEGSVFIGGAVMQWLRDELRIIRSAAESAALARSVPDSGGVFLVPAFAGLGAPYWDPRARGVLLGLTRGSGRAHVVRAALESIAYQSADLLGAMQADAGLRLRELRVDGGAARNDFLMQFQADLLGVPVVRPRVAETTALGAAYLAGLAIGFWPDCASIEKQWRPQARFEPRLSRDAAAARLAQWRRAVERSRHWA